MDRCTDRYLITHPVAWSFNLITIIDAHNHAEKITDDFIHGHLTTIKTNNCTYEW